VFNSITTKDPNPADRIFPNWKATQLSTAFARLCGKLKIVDFRFHDLRHTAASWMRMAGADIHTVATLLGHKNLRTAQRYQHLSSAGTELYGNLKRHKFVAIRLTFCSLSAPNVGRRAG
jgi:integrase